VNGKLTEHLATHTQLDPAVEAGLEATVGAPLQHWVIVAEDINGRIVLVTPDDQAPHISLNLARSSVDRLG
jgi:hypothetical protein